MSRFMFLYKGPVTPVGQFTEEQSARQTAAWNQWMAKVGPALVDGGQPFAARTSLVDDGTTTEASDLNGYSIVEADSLDAATALAVGHPFLSEGNGRFSLEIFELAPLPPLPA